MLPNALRPRHCLRLSHYLLVIHPHAPPHHWVPLTTSLYKPFPVPSNSDGQGPVFSCRGSFWKVGAILQISQLMLVLTALLSVTFQHRKRKGMTYFCLYFFFDPQCVLNFPKVSVVEPSKVKKVDHRQNILFKNWMFFFLSLSICFKHVGKGTYSATARMRGSADPWELLFSCQLESQQWKSGYRDRWQAPLPADPSHQPLHFLF